MGEPQGQERKRQSPGRRGKPRTGTEVRGWDSSLSVFNVPAGLNKELLQNQVSTNTDQYVSSSKYNV